MPDQINQIAMINLDEERNIPANVSSVDMTVCNCPINTVDRD